MSKQHKNDKSTYVSPMAEVVDFENESALLSSSQTEDLGPEKPEQDWTRKRTGWNFSHNESEDSYWGN